MAAFILRFIKFIVPLLPPELIELCTSLDYVQFYGANNQEEGFEVFGIMLIKKNGNQTFFEKGKKSVVAIRSMANTGIIVNSEECTALTIPISKEMREKARGIVGK